MIVYTGCMPSTPLRILLLLLRSRLSAFFSRITWLADRSAQNVGDLRVSGAVHRSVATRVGSRQICTASDQVACYDQPVLSLQRRRQAQLNLTRTITESVSSRNHRRSSWHLLQAGPGLLKEKQRKSSAVFTYQPDRWPTVAQPTRWKLWKRTHNTDSTTYQPSSFLSLSQQIGRSLYTSFIPASSYSKCACL